MKWQSSFRYAYHRAKYHPMLNGLFRNRTIKRNWRYDLFDSADLDCDSLCVYDLEGTWVRIKKYEKE